MPVTVSFSGPMLFVRRRASVDVVIPMSEVARNGVHPDNTEAPPHYAWLAAMTLEPGERGLDASYQCRERLLGATLDLGDEADGAPENADAVLEKAFSINPFVASLERHGKLQTDPRRAPSQVAARIRLRGGRLELGQMSPYEWLMVDHFARSGDRETRVDGPAYSISWVSDREEIDAVLELRRDPKDDAVHQIATARRTIRLSSEAIVQVANMDDSTPENWSIPSTKSAEPGDGPFIDHDFKWIYALFPAKWEEVLRDPVLGTRIELPAPTLPPLAYGAAARPSCHGGWVSEDLLRR